MTLEDLFERLALGELSQHNFGKTGVIQPKDYPSIIVQLNAGLTALHTALPLREEEVIIQQQADLTEYVLLPKYARSNTESTEPVKYIIDTFDKPFTRTIVRINSAFDEEGYPLPLNDEADCRSLFTASYNVIQVPYPDPDNVFVLVYQANHEKIPTDTTDLTIEIDIPISLEEALAAYIAGRCFVSMGNQSSGQLSGYYMNRYEEQLAYVKRNNLFQVGDVDSNIKLGLKGFV